MNTFAIAFVVVLGIAALIYARITQKPNPFDARGCMGKAWKRAFPDASNQHIREYLDCLVNGMDLDQPKLAFDPDDKVIDIYRSIYGGRTPLGDFFECETYLSNIDNKFGVSPGKILEDVWTNEQVTLGQIYAYIRA
jgi:hypothetical protein